MTKTIQVCCFVMIQVNIRKKKTNSFVFTIDTVVYLTFLTTTRNPWTTATEDKEIPRKTDVGMTRKLKNKYNNVEISGKGNGISSHSHKPTNRLTKTRIPVGKHGDTRIQQNTRIHNPKTTHPEFPIFRILIYIIFFMYSCHEQKIQQTTITIRKNMETQNSSGSKCKDNEAVQSWTNLYVGLYCNSV